MANHTKGLYIVLSVFMIIFTMATENILAKKSPEKRTPTQIRRDTTSGLLELYHDSHWRLITSSSMHGTGELKVLCRNMGLPADFTSVHYGVLKALPPAGSVSMYLDCVGNETDVKQCQAYSIHTYNEITDATISLNCTGLSFELPWGLLQNTSGVVATRYPNSKLMPLCVDPQHFDNRGAQIICRKLGLPSDHAITIHQFKFMLPETHLYYQSVEVNLVCPNDSSPASQCYIHTPYYVDAFCSLDAIVHYRNKLVAVTCTDEALQYRLTNVQQDSGIGRLEVRIAGRGWGTVCAQKGRNSFAKVACESLNLTSSAAQAYTNVFYGGAMQANLQEGTCDGTETDISDCLNNQWGIQCTSQQYIGLKCGNASQGQLRVSGLNGGRVSIYHGIRWYYIAVNSSKYEATQIATVVCRNLNLSTVAVSYKFGFARKIMNMTLVQCTGQEKAFSECVSTAVDKYNLLDFEGAFYVQCDARDEAVRLESGELLQVRRNGRWGTVCDRRLYRDTAFSNFSASVICESLNKQSSLASVFHKPNGSHSVPISLHGLECNSSSKSIKDCTYNHWVDSHCEHKDDVYITCDELYKSSVKYRMKSDHFPNVGIFEMYVNGMWGRVVMRDDYIERTYTAQVYCRSLNLNTLGARFVDLEEIVEPFGDYKIWLDNVICNGWESSVLDCNHMYIGDYVHSSDVKPVIIYCAPPDLPSVQIPNYSLRLVGGPNNHSGVLEMYMYGTWTSLCSSWFYDTEAKAACRSMGLPASLAHTIGSTIYNESTGNLWKVGISCLSFSYSFRTCAITRSAYCTNTRAVQVVCKDIDYLIHIDTPFKIPSITIGVGRSARRIAWAVGGSLTAIGLASLCAAVTTHYRRSRARRNAGGVSQPNSAYSVQYAQTENVTQTNQQQAPMSDTNGRPAY